MQNLGKALQQLREEHSRARLLVGKLDQAIVMIESLNGAGVSRTHTMSPAGRKRISLAQKKRWARVRAQNVVSITSKRGKRKLSAAGRRRIVAAARARWAKIRAGKKK